MKLNNEKNIESYDSLEDIDSLFKESVSICSYLAMFPLWVPEKYIKKYTKEGDIVYDPFSGRGTTSIAAIKNNRIAYSNDLSPLAFVLTKAQNYFVKNKKLVLRVQELEQEYNKWILKNFKKNNDSIFDDINVFYSEKNLNQLLFLREKLGVNYKKLSIIDNYILAISLGIMHGQTKVDGTSNYFSVSMPNGYSMSPNYAKNYIEKNNLKLIESNIFDQIISRIHKKNNEHKNIYKNKVFHNNSLNSSRFIKEKPDLIFTSPPYLNIVKYVSQNWIRFWILGFSKNDTKKNIVDDFHNLNSYESFLIQFLNEMEKIMKKETILMLVVGDVKEFKIKDIIDRVIYKTNLKLVGEPEKQEIRKKLSSQMGNRKGNATPNDWVFKIRIK